MTTLFDSAAAYLQRGGVVMLPLLLVSLLMWAAIIYRLLLLKKLCDYHISPAQVLRQLHDNSPVVDGGVTARLLHTIRQRRSGDIALDRRVIDEAVLAVGERLDNGLTLIGVLAAIAPLLGLLGTVVGMIATFETIAIFGTGNARALAGGISQALITTQTGLIIAIAGLYMRNFLLRRVENLRQHLFSLGIYLKRHLGDNIAEVAGD